MEPPGRPHVGGFSAHHMAAISSAIVMADATVILNQAAYLSLFSQGAGGAARVKSAGRALLGPPGRSTCYVSAALPPVA